MRSFSRVSLALLLGGTAALGNAQSTTPHRLVGVGTFAQSAPGAFSDVGVAIHGAVLIPLGAAVDIAPELEFSEAFQVGSEDVCYFGPDVDGPCLHRPTSETVLSLGRQPSLAPGLWIRGLSLRHGGWAFQSQSCSVSPAGIAHVYRPDRLDRAPPSARRRWLEP